MSKIPISVDDETTLDLCSEAYANGYVELSENDLEEFKSVRDAWYDWQSKLDKLFVKGSGDYK